MSVAVGGTVVVVSEYFSRRRLHASLVLENSYYWRQLPLFVKLVGRTGVGGWLSGRRTTPFFLRTKLQPLSHHQFMHCGNIFEVTK